MRRDDLVHVGVPAAEIVGELVLGALRHPGLDLPVVALDKADEVHDLAAPHRIVQHMAVRPEPVDALHLLQVRRQLLHRHQAAPGHRAGEHRLVGAEQRGAHLGVDAVGADHVGGARARRPRSAPRRDRLRTAMRGAAPAELHGVGLDRLHGVGQQAVQVAPVQHHMRRAVALRASPRRDRTSSRSRRCDQCRITRRDGSTCTRLSASSRPSA